MKWSYTKVKSPFSWKGEGKGAGMWQEFYPQTTNSRPIRSQYSGHVSTLDQSEHRKNSQERESFYRNFLAEKTFGFCVSQNFFPTLLFVIIIFLSKLPGFCFTLLSSVQVIYLNILCAIKNQMTKGPLTLSILDIDMNCWMDELEQINH